MKFHHSSPYHVSSPSRRLHFQLRWRQLRWAHSHFQRNALHVPRRPNAGNVRKWCSQEPQLPKSLSLRLCQVWGLCIHPGNAQRAIKESSAFKCAIRLNITHRNDHNQVVQETEANKGKCLMHWNWKMISKGRSINSIQINTLKILRNQNKWF